MKTENRMKGRRPAAFSVTDVTKEKGRRMKKLLKEFETFIMRGNVIDMPPDCG